MVTGRRHTKEAYDLDIVSARSRCGKGARTLSHVPEMLYGSCAARSVAGSLGTVRKEGALALFGKLPCAAPQNGVTH